MGIEHFSIELVEEFPCQTIQELRRQEGVWIKELGTLNKQVAGRSWEQYLLDTKDKWKEYHKKYKSEHTEQIQENRKKWAENNKEKTQDYMKKYAQSHLEKVREHKRKWGQKNQTYVRTKLTCECGCEVSRANMSRHLQSDKHFEIMKKNICTNIDNND
eukprot:4953613-Amphidinium_carterae.1